MSDTFNNIASAIQLALTPAFLLSGIAAMLNVMAGRLSRIVDRGGKLTEDPTGPVSCQHESVSLELRHLERRRHLTSVAITACTIAALLVCLVIAALSLEVMIDVPLKWPIGAPFILAILALIVGLAFFLCEVHLAMKDIHITTTKAK